MTATDRLAVAIAVVEKLGAARAKDGAHIHSGGHDNKVGYAGVDFPAGGRKFRARIRFMDSLSGNDTRVTLGRFDNAEDAGYAYKVAHVALWGALSCFVSEVTVEQIEAARVGGLVSDGRADSADPRSL